MLAPCSELTAAWAAGGGRGGELLISTAGFLLLGKLLATGRDDLASHVGCPAPGAGLGFWAKVTRENVERLISCKVILFFE